MEKGDIAGLRYAPSILLFAECEDVAKVMDVENWPKNKDLFIQTGWLTPSHQVQHTKHTTVTPAHPYPKDHRRHTWSPRCPPTTLISNFTLITIMPHGITFFFLHRAVLVAELVL